MKSRAGSKFWKAYRELPADIQRLAVKQYRLWMKDSAHPSLQFKKVRSYWSCRVTDSYRALAIMDGDYAIWFWIGTHAEYEQILRQKR
jgi:hypothetical protein